MGLLEQIEEVWANGAAAKATEWAMQLSKAKPKLIDAGKKFREWYPLQVYSSYTRATKPHITFSLRYLGQEVAHLGVKDNDVSLVIPKKTYESNLKYFGIGLQSGTYEWKGSESRSFRKHFLDLHSSESSVKVKCEEHKIEAEFLRQMANPTINKFAGTLKGIQPVLLAGCPFQFPLPISGNTGVPKRGNGNIDIIARRGSGKGRVGS